MKNVIALRSYGDYVILLNSIKNVSNINITVYASKHLEALHNAIYKQAISNINFVFLDLGVKNGIFPFFTNIHFFSIANLRSIMALKKAFKNINDNFSDYYLEQKKRTILFNLLTFNSFKYIHNSNNNIYESYQLFFESKNNIVDSQIPKNNLNVVIFPDSRKKEKEIAHNIINKISKSCNHKIKIAKFGNNNTQGESIIIYENFIQLIQIIKDADFIISSDSLPAHLANYLNKPHWVIYNNTINNEWLTPYCISKNTYCLSTSIKQLTEILKN